MYGKASFKAYYGSDPISYSSGLRPFLFEIFRISCHNGEFHIVDKVVLEKQCTAVRSSFGLDIFLSVANSKTAFNVPIIDWMQHCLLLVLKDHIK